MAKDGEEIGTVEDGNVLGRDRQFVCSLVLLDSATASLTIPDALKTLMDTGA